MREKLKENLERLEEIWYHNPSWFATKDAVIQAIKELEKQRCFKCLDSVHWDDIIDILGTADKEQKP